MTISKKYKALTYIIFVIGVLAVFDWLILLKAIIAAVLILVWALTSAWIADQIGKRTFDRWDNEED